MSTPQERAMSVDLAIKALGVRVMIKDPNGGESPLIVAAKVIERYITEPATVETPTTKTETHDVTIETRNEEQLTMAEVDAQTLNCARCGALHIVGETYDHEYEKPRDVVNIVDAKPKKCSICGTDRENFRHDAASQGSGGHAYRAPQSRKN